MGLAISVKAPWRRVIRIRGVFHTTFGLFSTSASSGAQRKEWQSLKTEAQSLFIQSEFFFPFSSMKQNPRSIKRGANQLSPLGYCEIPPQLIERKWKNCKPPGKDKNAFWVQSYTRILQQQEIQLHPEALPSPSGLPPGSRQEAEALYASKSEGMS